MQPARPCKRRDVQRMQHQTVPRPMHPGTHCPPASHSQRRRRSRRLVQPGLRQAGQDKHKQAGEEKNHFNVWPAPCSTHARLETSAPAALALAGLAHRNTAMAMDSSTTTWTPTPVLACLPLGSPSPHAMTGHTRVRRVRRWCTPRPAVVWHTPDPGLACTCTWPAPRHGPHPITTTNAACHNPTAATPKPASPFDTHKSPGRALMRCSRSAEKEPWFRPA